MDLLMIILLLIGCLLISNIIGHYLPFIPTALIQIAIGVILALLFSNITLELETEWFLLLFVAPLLYNDGRNFPREELWNMKMPILGNAIILVLITTLAGGYFIHWLIPSIPLAAAFALAAILSPTDPVAVNGIAKRIQIPEKILNVVRGESLINDASGLVAFKYAVVAVVTGYFSIKEALLNFSYTFLIGGILGLVVGTILTQIRFSLRRAGIRDVIFHTLLQLLTPFIVYLVAEDVFHASGVIAVVVAGIAQALVKDKTEILLAEEQLLTENTWSIVLFILNGIVFLLLGLNIPSSMEESIENTSINNWKLIGYALAIGIVILGIRFLWSHFNAIYSFKKGNDDQPTLKKSLLSSFVGVRGAVTMAGVLSLPFITESGSFFPERSLILFLASAVILFTLIVATIFLPILIDSSEVGDVIEKQHNFNEAKKQLLLVSINRIHREMNDDNRNIAYQLIGEYQQMFRQVQIDTSAAKTGKPKYQSEITKIRLQALVVEEQYIEELYKGHHLDQDMYTAIQSTFSERKRIIQHNMQKGFSFVLYRIIREWRMARKKYLLNKEKFVSYVRMKQVIRKNAYEHALEFLREQAKLAPNPEIYYMIAFEYERAISLINKEVTTISNKHEELKNELRTVITETERAEIHRMYEAGEISKEEERDLRRFVNYIESVNLYEHVE
ncbi:Na+/H+ antiporter [uncultured Rummeliibacillus sp.]|uniref:Na+/H+ antiporter n=1 Tax=uncultured Rummeliibacillus sp. TaxID=762292 RepID=UPI002628474C|nr:Na+/H+ antiporter [uncultured Rummeliibacillus sp.]